MTQKTFFYCTQFLKTLIYQAMNRAILILNTAEVSSHTFGSSDVKLVQTLHEYIMAHFLKLSMIYILTTQMELFTYKDVHIKDITLPTGTHQSEKVFYVVQGTYVQFFIQFLQGQSTMQIHASAFLSLILCIFMKIKYLVKDAFGFKENVLDIY